MGDFKENFQDYNLGLTPILFIVLGAVIFVIAFFGCCGAINESRCMTAVVSFFFSKTTNTWLILFNMIPPLAVLLLAAVDFDYSNRLRRDDLHEHWRAERILRKGRRKNVGGAWKANEILGFPPVQCKSSDFLFDFETHKIFFGLVLAEMLRYWQSIAVGIKYSEIVLSRWNICLYRTKRLSRRMHWSYAWICGIFWPSDWLYRSDCCCCWGNYIVQYNLINGC